MTTKKKSENSENSEKRTVGIQKILEKGMLELVKGFNQFFGQFFFDQFLTNFLDDLYELHTTEAVQ